jgi:hypothetical protein
MVVASLVMVMVVGAMVIGGSGTDNGDGNVGGDAC